MQPDVFRTNSRRAQWVVVGLVTLALGCGSDATAPTVDDPGLGEGPFQGWFIAAGENRLVFSQDGNEWYDVDQFGESVLNLTGRSMIDVAATRSRLVLTEVNEGEISRFQSGPDRMEVRTIPSPSSLSPRINSRSSALDATGSSAPRTDSISRSWTRIWAFPWADSRSIPVSSTEVAAT